MVLYVKGKLSRPTHAEESSDFRVLERGLEQERKVHRVAPARKSVMNSLDIGDLIAQGHGDGREKKSRDAERATGGTQFRRFAQSSAAEENLAGQTSFSEAKIHDSCRTP